MRRALLRSGAQQRHGTMLQVVGCAAFEMLAARPAGKLVPGIKNQLPTNAALVGGKDECDRLVVRVEEQEEGIVPDRITLSIHLCDRVSGKPHAETTGKSLAPVLFGHFFAVRPEPGNVFDFGAMNMSPLKKLPAVEDRMLLAQFDEEDREFQKGLVGF